MMLFLRICFCCNLICGLSLRARDSLKKLRSLGKFIGAAPPKEQGVIPKQEVALLQQDENKKSFFGGQEFRRKLQKQFHQGDAAAPAESNALPQQEGPTRESDAIQDVEEHTTNLLPDQEHTPQDDNQMQAHEQDNFIHSYSGCDSDDQIENYLAAPQNQQSCLDVDGSHDAAPAEAEQDDHVPPRKQDDDKPTATLDWRNYADISDETKKLDQPLFSYHPMFGVIRSPIAQEHHEDWDYKTPFDFNQITIDTNQDDEPLIIGIGGAAKVVSCSWRGRKCAMKVFTGKSKEKHMRDELDVLRHPAFKNNRYIIELFAHSPLDPRHGINQYQNPPLNWPRKPPLLEDEPVTSAILFPRGIYGSLIALDTHREDELKEIVRENLVSIVEQIISGLAVIHNAGYCHRDVKLDNILLMTIEPEVTIQWIDFGCAQKDGWGIGKRVKDPKDGIIDIEHCTVAKCAPELYLEQNRKFSQASDMFSLGLALFDLCSYLYGLPLFWDQGLFRGYADVLDFQKNAREGNLAEIQSFIQVRLDSLYEVGEIEERVVRTIKLLLIAEAECRPSAESLRMWFEDGCVGIPAKVVQNVLPNVPQRACCPKTEGCILS